MCPHAILHVLTRRAHCSGDGLPLDELDGLERFVHVADGEVEAEVEHGIPGGLLAVLQANKVPERSPGHHSGELGSRTPRWLRLMWSSVC